MSDRIQQLQDRFNKAGSELLQVELAIIRFKDALSKSTDRKNSLMQSLIAIDDEFQALRRAQEVPADPSQEIKFKEVTDETSLPVNSQSNP